MSVEITAQRSEEFITKQIFQNKNPAEEHVEWIELLEEFGEYYCEAYGLELVYVNNEFEDERTGEEGINPVYLGGEVLLCNMQDPKLHSVFFVTGGYYERRDMDGDIRYEGLMISEKILMYLNGEPLWQDFELDFREGSRSDWHYEDDIDPKQEGLGSSKKRVEALLEQVNKLAPRKPMTKTDARELLEELAEFFAPESEY